ncbi:sporulation integral membrane protein YtvI [Clostridium cadaveris]|uniref:sporulation integral membrane protein YtvI n=1 Tax=Clostridium cadaveris TaxID=1529 RepID=UPI00311AB1D4
MKLLDIDNKRNFIINVLYFITVSALIFVAIKYGLIWFMPFVIGFAVSSILKPLISFLSEKLHISRKPLSAIVVLLFYAIVVGLLILLGTRLFISMKELFLKLPDMYSSSIEPAVYNMFSNIESILGRLDPALVKDIEAITISFSNSLGSVISSVSSTVISSIYSIFSSIPSFFITVILSIISSFFFTIDYTRITTFIVRQFSPKVRDIIFDVKHYIVGTLFKFIKAYSILMALTFLELSLGFFILRIENGVTIAAIIALLDILPILGTGGILIPWVIIELIRGNVYLALGLATLYMLITVVRNILEPKIVGAQVGMHPIVMLICMFVGVKVFGFIGLFILPAIAIIIKNLNDSGKIHLFK